MKIFRRQTSPISSIFSKLQTQKTNHKLLILSLISMFSTFSKLHRANHKLLLFSLIQSRFIFGGGNKSKSGNTHDQIYRLIIEQKSANEAIHKFRWASKIPSFTHTRSTYGALIEKLCIFRQFKIVEQVLGEMPKSIGLYPDDDIFVTIVRGFAKAKMTKEVIGVMQLVAKFGKGKPSLKVKNSILDYLVRHDIDTARDFYRRKIGVKGDDCTYQIWMKGLCLTHRFTEAFRLLKSLNERGVNVSVVVYNTLIYALCKYGSVGRARNLMREMKEFSDVTFDTMISVYLNAGHLVQALVMIDECLQNGLFPDVVLLNKVINVFCNTGRLLEAVDLLEWFEEKGGTSDVVLYNSLIKGFVKVGKVQMARGFLKQMEMTGCLPNTDTYNALIAGFCEAGMLDLALDMFNEMKIVGVNWNIVTFETLIYGFCSRGMTNDGFKIFELVRKCKLNCLHVGPYNIILYGLYKENRLVEALEFLNSMRNLFPQAVDTSLKILQLSQEGRIDDAKDVFQKMKEQWIAPNVLVYVILVEGLYENGSLKAAIELLNEMIGHGYFPNSPTFKALIDGLCRKGNVHAAVSLIDDLKKRGVEPEFESYGLIINDFCSEGDIEQAFKLLMEMVERGLTPDYCVWNALVVGLFRWGNRACKMVPNHKDWGGKMLPNHKVMAHNNNRPYSLPLYSDRAYSSVSETPGPLDYCKSRVNQGKLQHDPDQEKVAVELDSKLGKLHQYEKDMGGPLDYCESLVNLGELEHDPYQEKVAVELDKLPGRLHQYEKDMGGPLDYCKSLVNQGKLQHDPHQKKVAVELDKLLRRFHQYLKDIGEYQAPKWEEDMEKERRLLLMHKAEAKQHKDAPTSVNECQNMLLKWMSWEDDAHVYVLLWHIRNSSTSKRAAVYEIF